MIGMKPLLGTATIRPVEASLFYMSPPHFNATCNPLCRPVCHVSPGPLRHHTTSLVLQRQLLWQGCCQAWRGSQDVCWGGVHMWERGRCCLGAGNRMTRCSVRSPSSVSFCYPASSHYHICPRRSRKAAAVMRVLHMLHVVVLHLVMSLPDLPVSSAFHLFASVALPVSVCLSVCLCPIICICMPASQPSPTH